ncbi:hypothetical protein D3C81_1130860 [compost metagenome]
MFKSWINAQGHANAARTVGAVDADDPGFVLNHRGGADLEAHPFNIPSADHELLALAAPAVLRGMRRPPGVIEREHRAIPGQVLWTRIGAVAVAI